MIFAIEENGVRPLVKTGIYLAPKQTYYLGAHSSPDLVVLESVNEQFITYYSRPYHTVSRITRRIGEDLLVKGTRTMIEQIKRCGCYERESWQRHVAALEAVLRGEPGEETDVADLRQVYVEIRPVSWFSQPFVVFEERYGDRLYGMKEGNLQASMSRRDMEELKAKVDLDPDFEIVLVADM